MSTYLGQVQNLEWASPSRIFASSVELFESQPNYEHEVVLAQDSNVKFQGVAPAVGGWAFATGEPVLTIPPPLPPPPPMVGEIVVDFPEMVPGEAIPPPEEQNLDWASPSRIFMSTEELFDSQPNYGHEVSVARDTETKYQGIAPIVGGWGFATGEPGPFVPPPPPPVNDDFTWILLECDGIEGSQTLFDTNGHGVPRVWTRHGYAGFGHITNTGELFYPGALSLDGQTVFTARDDVRFNFGTGEFTIRGYFLCDFDLGEFRVLAAKGDQAGSFVFMVGRDEIGRFVTWLGGAGAGGDSLMDRDDIDIVDRGGQLILMRSGTAVGIVQHQLRSTTIFGGETNPGWHEFKVIRVGATARLFVDDVEEDLVSVGTESMLVLPGPLTIAGYGPPLNGVYQGDPWIGGLDRFAVDIGIAR